MQLYFVFIDEAGTPGFKNGKSPEGYFTLACMIVKSENLLKIEKKLRDVKAWYDIHPNEEFKWGSKYSKSGLTYQTYCELRTDMFSLIRDYSETVIASVLDKKDSFKKDYINDHFELYQNALYYCMERIHKWFSDPGVVPGPVVFVIDSRKNNKEADLDEKLNESFKRALNKGTYYISGGFPNFSETAFFTPSESSAGLQLADYCAGPIQQIFTSGKADWYNVLKDKIRKSPEGIISGYGIKCFPGRPTIQL